MNQPTAVAGWTPFGGEERAEFGDHARPGGTHSRRAKCCHELLSSPSSGARMRSGCPDCRMHKLLY